MKYIKLRENFNSDEINATEYFNDIVDLLNHRNKSIEQVDIVDDEILLGDKKVTLDKYGNVKIVNGNVHKIIGRIQLRSSIDDSGNINDFSFQENEYDDGAPIKLGDHVIVNGEYHATVDGFNDGNIMVKDQEEEIFYVKPSEIKREVKRDPPSLEDYNIG